MTPIDRFSQSTILTINSPPQKPTISSAISTARRAFASNTTLSYSFRKQQLLNLLRFLNECRDGIIRAVHQDLHKPPAETLMAEIDLVKNDLKHTLFSLKSWMGPTKPEKRLINLLDDVRIQHDPYGVVLIMSAWNYPFLLLVGPLVGAIAAGNCVVMKPSELAENSAEFIAKHLPKYLDRSCYHVLTGGVEFTTELLRNRFDYILFTGSTAIGKIVHKAAAEHLTPTTLELGGKSPAYLDDDIDIKRATRRLLWGKLLNAGQTCISPDYVLCSEQTQTKLVEAAREVLTEFYGEDVMKSPHLSRIITQRHFNRLCNFLKDGNCAVGGQTNPELRKIAPTILTDVKSEDSVMQEEIFGPILPIVTIQSPEEAVEFIKNRDKPLVVYVFTKRKQVEKMFVEKTSSGAMAINDTVVQMTTENLPFGGVGASGMGNYHSKYGFDTFSHKKSILAKGLGVVSEMMMESRYPPYTEFKTGFLSAVVAKRREWISYGTIRNLVVFGAGMGCVWMVQWVRAQSWDD